MTQPLTTEYLDQALQKLASKDDLHHLEASMATKGDLGIIAADFRAVKADVAETKTTMNQLVVSVDTYLKRTETWHDELIVLQARFNQVVHLLDQRGVIKEEESHIA